MAEIDTAHPTVTRMVHKDAVPTVVFVFGIPAVDFRLQSQVLDSAFRDFTICCVSEKICSAVTGRECCGDGGVDGDGAPVNSRDGAVPGDIDVCRLPSRVVQTASEILHFQMFNPFPGRGTDDVDPVAHSQLMIHSFHLENRRTSRKSLRRQKKTIIPSPPGRGQVRVIIPSPPGRG